MTSANCAWLGDVKTLFKDEASAPQNGGGLSAVMMRVKTKPARSSKQTCRPACAVRRSSHGPYLTPITSLFSQVSGCKQFIFLHQVVIDLKLCAPRVVTVERESEVAALLLCTLQRCAELERLNCSASNSAWRHQAAPNDSLLLIKICMRTNESGDSAVLYPPPPPNPGI